MHPKFHRGRGHVRPPQLVLWIVRYVPRVQPRLPFQSRLAYSPRNNGLSRRHAARPFHARQEVFTEERAGSDKTRAPPCESCGIRG